MKKKLLSIMPKVITIEGVKVTEEQLIHMVDAIYNFFRDKELTSLRLMIQGKTHTIKKTSQIERDLHINNYILRYIHIEELIDSSIPGATDEIVLFKDHDPIYQIQRYNKNVVFVI